MSRDKIRAAFKMIKQSEEFELVIPRGRELLFGIVKHNMPHEFYALHRESQVILVGHHKYGLLWMNLTEDSVRTVKSILSAEAEKNNSWPYVSHVIPKTSSLMSTEDILSDGHESLKEFVIFNLNLFT